MFIKSRKDIKMRNVAENGAKDVKVCWVISKEDGANNFYMRLFQVELGGYTPFHSHPWEHEAFIKSGEGVLVYEGGKKKFKKGDFIFVKEGEKHQFKNTSKSKTLELICCIPEKGVCG